MFTKTYLYSIVSITVSNGNTYNCVWEVKHSSIILPFQPPGNALCSSIAFAITPFMPSINARVGGLLFRRPYFRAVLRTLLPK